MRWKVNKNRDKKFFRRTAASTKSVNLGNNIMRGGIRF